MKYRARIGQLIIAAALAGTEQAIAQGEVATAEVAARISTDSDQPLTGDAYARATAAALEFTGLGTVTETEAEGPRGSEVEVRLNDGRQVEVQLDQNFAVIGSEADDDGPHDDDRGWDDD